MPNNIEPAYTPVEEEKASGEQLADFKQAKFKFGCLGINCLGWVMIIIIIFIIYYLMRSRMT